jgi:hypothetical protein
VLLLAAAVFAAAAFAVFAVFAVFAAAAAVFAAAVFIMAAYTSISGKEKKDPPRLGTLWTACMKPHKGRPLRLRGCDYLGAARCTSVLPDVP